MALKTKTASAPKFFYQRLVLANWLLGEMGFADFEAAKNCLLESDEDERDGLTRWGRAIFTNAPARRVDDATLRDFDGNIARHWEHITRERSAGTHAPQLKYFQYLALLATEIYLDRWFRSHRALREELNDALNFHNTKNGDSLPPYADADLQKLAFWSATGSGKTLLMHVQVLQWLHHAARARDLGWENAPPPLDKIILLTPNERLSVQHRHEAHLSGLPARVLSGQNHNSPLPFGGSAAMLPIETIEISKLGDNASENVIALETLNGHNLLLVDEAHRGLSGSTKDVREWKKRRDELRKNGFCFEYSATFEQVVGTPSSEIAHEYAKCVALDYSYRRFYHDGFGKDFRVFNLPAGEIDGGENWARERYLCACLLQFALQLQAFARSGPHLRAWGFEKPLWIFVGSRVTQGLSESEASDVVEIVRFLADFLNQSAQYRAHLDALLNRQSGLYADGADPFAHAFDALEVRDANAVYQQIVRDVFNAPAGGALRLELLTRADGEIALRVGENAPFGVINVGEAAKLRDRCRTDEKLGALVRDDNALAAPIFAQLGASTCSANLLIGARKFIEGWNSYRVATMGLMNVGRGEGSQIIQLFGRGVRLRGRDGSLQRTQNFAALPATVRRDDVRVLETLQVFGLKSDYMKQWQQAIETAGLPSGEVPHTETIRTRLADFPALMTLTVPAARSFENSGHTVTLGRWHLDGQAQKTLNVQTIKIDLYPKLQALSGASADGAPDVETATQTFGDAQLDWIDWDRVMRVLREMKTTKKTVGFAFGARAVARVLPRFELVSNQSARRVVSWRHGHANFRANARPVAGNAGNLAQKPRRCAVQARQNRMGARQTSIAAVGSRQRSFIDSGIYHHDSAR